MNNFTSEAHSFLIPCWASIPSNSFFSTWRSSCQASSWLQLPDPGSSVGCLTWITWSMINKLFLSNLLTLAWRAVLEVPPSPWQVAWPSCRPCPPRRQRRHSSLQHWLQAGWGSPFEVAALESRWCGQLYDHLPPNWAPDICCYQSPGLEKIDYISKYARSWNIKVNLK